MKKLVSIVFFSVLFVVCLAGCGTQGANPGSEVEKSPKLKIVTTIFPVYDWTRSILGDQTDHAELTMLLDQGVDLHNYQPTAEDLLKISSCDVFIYVGGESDEWVKDALKTVQNKNMVVLNLMEALGGNAKEEEHVEGMEDHHHHGHAEDKDHDDEDNHSAVERTHEEHADEEDAHHGHDEREDDAHCHIHKGEYDEHIWLSLKNAVLLTDAVEKALSRADASHAAVYQKNAVAYKASLSALDDDYKKAFSSASNKTLLFGDRFPFRYMVDDYGLHYYAAFFGCSAETEASFETIAFLTKKLNELQLPAVLTIEGRTHKIAETIVKNSNSPDTPILTVDSMQSTTGADAVKTTYLGIMKKNLGIFMQAVQ